MKRHALAALIASLFVITACGQQAADQSARHPAEAAAASAQKAGAQVPIRQRHSNCPSKHRHDSNE